MGNGSKVAAIDWDKKSKISSFYLIFDNNKGVNI